jgi:hypothetical protein
MIIVTRPDATEEQIDHIVTRIRSWGLKTEVSRGEMRVVIGVIGPEDKIREKPLGAFPGVESVTPVLKPYKLVTRIPGICSHIQVKCDSRGERSRCDRRPLLGQRRSDYCDRERSPSSWSQNRAWGRL